MFSLAYFFFTVLISVHTACGWFRKYWFEK